MLVLSRKSKLMWQTAIRISVHRVQSETRNGQDLSHICKKDSKSVQYTRYTYQEKELLHTDIQCHS